MVRDALSNYLTLASGLTELTRQRAVAAAKALVAQGGATVEQVSGLAEEVLETSRANRTALVNLVRYEIEHTLARLGLASAEDVAALRQQVAELEKALREQRGSADAGPVRTAATPTKQRKSTKVVSAPKAAPATRRTPAKSAKSAKAAAPAKSARKAAAARKAAQKPGAVGGSEV